MATLIHQKRSKAAMVLVMVSKVTVAEGRNPNSLSTVSFWNVPWLLLVLILLLLERPGQILVRMLAPNHCPVSVKR